MAEYYITKKLDDEERYILHDLCCPEVKKMSEFYKIGECPSISKAIELAVRIRYIPSIPCPICCKSFYRL